MANENAFSTPRNNAPSPSAALNAVIQRRAMQAQNRQALAEAKELEKTLADGTAMMDAAVAQATKDAQRVTALENLAHQQGTRNIARGQIGMRQRIIKVGMEETRKKVLEELVYEAYWLDDPVKECTVNQITDSIEDVMGYVDENFRDARIAESDYSPLLKNVSLAIEQVVTKAAERIYKAALESGEVDPEFELTDSEEEELDTKLGDLGRDEIVDLIKTKVASVVQDEKQKGQERAEMFKALDGEINSDGGDTETGEGESTEDEGEVSTEEGTVVRNVDHCDINITNCKCEGGDGDEPDYPVVEPTDKTALEAAITATSTNVGYTSGEKYFAKMLENGQALNLVAEDPTWNDFKVCISMLSKKARDLILKGRGGCPECYLYAKDIMTELMKQISTAGENVPVEVKQFVLASVNMIFAPIPGDEAIISRFGVSLGSPETQSASPAINWETVSWSDIMANIKTNLTSASDWCTNKGDTEYKVIDNDKLNDSECPVSGKSALAQKVAAKQNQLLNQNIGGTLFEALTINAIENCKSAAMESGTNVSDEDTEDAALVEALLYYTIFETLDTIGLYKFRMGDMGKLQRTLVRSVTEGSSPFGAGKDKKGLKKVRINTKKMKQKKDINGKPTSGDKVAEM